MIKSFQINSYDVLYATTLNSSQKDGPIFSNYCSIVCHGDDGMTMNVYFPLENAVNAAPVTRFDLNYGSVIQPVSTLEGILALLNGHQQVYGYLNDGNPSFNAVSTVANI